MQWARANGCPWDERTCEGAAYSGNLEVLQWLRANGCPWDWRNCEAAATDEEHFDVASWVLENKTMTP